MIPKRQQWCLAALRGEGIRILENTKVVSVEKRGKTGVRVHVEGPEGKAQVDGIKAACCCRACGQR